jgi:hypothetical protein
MAANQILAAAVTTSALALLLAGCSSAPPDALDLPAKNIDQWVMPLDEFVTSMAGQRDYAEALLIEPCMTKAGFEFPVPWQSFGRDDNASYSPTGQRLFSIELAAEYGYHAAPSGWEGKDEWRAFGEKVNALAESTKGYDDMLDSCRTDARTRIPLPSDDAMYYGASSTSQSYTEALLDPTVQAAVPGWTSCMKDAGFSDVEADPADMPGDALSEEWQLPIPGTVAGDEEIAMATADAQCSMDSGWTEAVYEAEWDWQVEFVAANQDRLIRVRQELDKTVDALQKVIRENAPAR